ncbi:cysteine desulfurase [candidate division KSB1 bacterium]|nr:cysteine desulfurase [candidate division KSB1 bacterium]
MDIREIRERFPIFAQRENRDLIYLDSAATTQKPDSVIKAVSRYYREYNANTHRGTYRIAEKATVEYERARKTIARFIGAVSERQVVFVRGTTEAINTVAVGWGDRVLKADDEIIFSELEHHSNIVPWQMLAQRTGARIRLWEMDKEGRLHLDALRNLLSTRTRLLAIAHVSNALGTVNPIAEIVQLAHDNGTRVLVDGAQSVPHQQVDVTALGVDFFAFSGHKMLGPTGIGVLYAREELLDEMNPVQFGGDMIESVQVLTSTWNDLPWKFEGGTPNIAGAIGLGAAVEFLQEIGIDAIHRHETGLIRRAVEQLQALPGVRVFGPPGDRGPAVSFEITGIHPHDISTLLDQRGIAIRSGHHCAQLAMKKLEVPATARASFYLYNDESEIDRFVKAVSETRDYFAKWL